MQTSDIALASRPVAHARAAAWVGLADRWPLSLLESPERRIRVVQSDEELEAVGRFRYALYIARDGKRYKGADHRRAIFVEKIDRRSLVFFAEHHGRMLATVRLVRGTDAIEDDHLRLLLEAAQPADLANVVVNSRFAVAPEMKARSLIVPMFQQVYRSGLLSGARHCFIATRSDLIAIFERFGFRPTAVNYSDHVAGSSIVLRLDLYDLDYLEKLGSPLLPVARELLAHAERMLHDHQC